MLHGLARSSASMRPLERELGKAGFATLNLDYPSRLYGIEALAGYVSDKAAGFLNQADGPLHIVTHSMGGLVADALIAAHRPPALGRVVMLAPPFGGSGIADRPAHRQLYRALLGPAGSELTTAARGGATAPDYELGVIAGTHALDPLGWLLLPRPNDGRVAVKSTRRHGVADHIMLPVTHALGMNRAVVACQVIHFLREGRFSHPD